MTGQKHEQRNVVSDRGDSDINDQELYNEIIWVMTHYGSDTGERVEPGSKLRSQAERIVQFVEQREFAYHLINQHDLRLLKVVSATPRAAQ